MVGNHFIESLTMRANLELGNREAKSSQDLAYFWSNCMRCLMSEVTKPRPGGPARLKLGEPDVSPVSPWHDDTLERAEVAARLTNLIQDIDQPFVMSIDGHWGTGKTFLLKRWHRDLEKRDVQAIYFNAWEDDFCDDPFLALLGQLQHHFKDSTFQEFTDDVLEAAKPLVYANLTGLLEKITGLKFRAPWKRGKRYLLNEYHDRRAGKDGLKKQLERLSYSVGKQTKHPLVFIVDELDRCRPTFAIELLERVKHVFDVPNLVFVFGINRQELCSALRSVYGDIDASVYLRRFFDMEFVMPPVDATQFGRRLMERYRLDATLGIPDENGRHGTRMQEYADLKRRFPELWSRIGLSLRDIDYCVRILALLGKNLEPQYRIYPALAGLLVTLKLKDPEMYRRIASDNFSAADVMDCIESEITSPAFDSPESLLEGTLDEIETFLYLVHLASRHQLELLSQGPNTPDNPELIPRRTRYSGPAKAGRLLKDISRELNPTVEPQTYPGDALVHILKSIDLCQAMVNE